MKTCAICEKEITKNAVEFNGNYLCHECYSTETRSCECCCERFLVSELIDGRVCQECNDENYRRCSDCGTLVHIDDIHYHNDDPFCDNCYRSNYVYIEDYYYKPTPIFYGTGQPHYGIELEIDDGGECDSCAEKIMNIANRECEHIYCKHDGSLDDGFEIVSHPATLSYHMNCIEWQKILSKAQEMGYTSHTAGTCGMHIHINRAAFGEGIEEQENTIGRIIYFFEKHWDKILRFSRRTEAQANRWASRYGCGTENPKESLKNAKASGLGRYTAVNLENTFTVELRIFMAEKNMLNICNESEFSAGRTTDIIDYQEIWFIASGMVFSKMLKHAEEIDIAISFSEKALRAELLSNSILKPYNGKNTRELRKGTGRCSGYYIRKNELKKYRYENGGI